MKVYDCASFLIFFYFDSSTGDKLNMVSEIGRKRAKRWFWWTLVFFLTARWNDKVTTHECFFFFFFVVVKVGASPPLCLLERRISEMLPNVSCYFKSMDEQRKGKTKWWGKPQTGALLRSQTQSRISIHLKSFFPATWQMKVQYSLLFLPSFWSAEDPEGNNVADESHTVFCR